MVDRIDKHNAASFKYPLRDDKTQKNEIPLALWGDDFAAQSSTAKNIEGTSLFDVSKQPQLIDNYDFDNMNAFSKQTPINGEQGLPLESEPLAETNPKVATCDFDTHPVSCDEPAIEPQKAPESKYCDFDTHPKSCDDEPVEPTSIKTYVKEGDTLGKYAKSLYGSVNPEVLKAIAEANPDTVKTVKLPNGKPDYRLAYDPKNLKELSLPYVIETSKATYATHEAFMPE